jgi:hypothetical protein
VNVQHIELADEVAEYGCAVAGHFILMPPFTRRFGSERIVYGLLPFCYPTR